MTSDAHGGLLPKLSRLVTVDVRDVWAHEAHSFTPWLLANADVLGEALGMDLALSQAEHPVGGFSLDLIGVDEATNELVIVENQLSATDHTHLGQLLTYAGGTEPTNVVWLATRFREEHRAALDWLNTRTDEDTRFFGVEVAAVRIGDSPPAPRFTLVAQPNDWGKVVKKSSVTTPPGPASARRLLYRDFWVKFLDQVSEERPGWTRSRKGLAQNWQPLPAGASGVAYNCVFGKGQLYSELYFQDPDALVNEARFKAALATRETLEAAYGSPLTFEPLDGKKGSRIATYRAGSIDQLDQWDAYVAWFIAEQTSLRSAVAAIGGFSALDVG
jgi:Domain of unknown function (DUF4268)